MSNQPVSNEEQALQEERYQALMELEEWLEMPMLMLGFVWLALMLIEYVWGLSPLLTTVIDVIWILFILDFIVKFILAPGKRAYLKANWLTVIALAVPALRVFRVFRVLRILRIARTARGLRLVRVVTSLNRGMHALRSTMSRRGFGYIVALSIVVTLTGASCMYAFEHESSEAMDTYGEALWWTAMVLTSLGSEYWPRTAEGRVLCFLLALYGFAVFGYVTATLATFFIGRDAEAPEGEVASARSIEALRTEIAALRSELRTTR
jgi:voltage-gated potassium channel